MIEGERNPSLTCNPGNYHLDIDRISVGCGIAQVLIQLCLNENGLDFHNVFNKYNEAMLKVSKLDDENRQWIVNNCKKVAYTKNLVQPLNLGSQYLQAAILSQFDRAIVMNSDLSSYPVEGVTFTWDLLARYDGNRAMVISDQSFNVDGTDWIFCSSK